MAYVHKYEHTFEGLPTLSPDTNNPICDTVYDAINYLYYYV